MHGAITRHDPGATAFELRSPVANRERLRALKKRYDPANVFRQNYNLA
jgi:FAD/FMN-containing dehydrogenase